MPVNAIWLVDFGLEYPAEPAGYLMVLVIGPPPGWLTTPNVVVVPFTNTPRGLRFYIEVEPTEENGLEEISYLNFEQIRSINQDRRVTTLGLLSMADRFRVDDLLRKMLLLSPSTGGNPFSQLPGVV